MEIFKPVVPDYEIGSLGTLRSLKSGKIKILNPTIDNHGYFRIGLMIDGERKFYRIHRLVAEAFIPNPFNLPEVNHINGVKTDNRVENLEWCTQRENVQHAFRTGLAAQGEKHYEAKLTNEQARYVRDNPNGLTGAQLAAKFGVCVTKINAIRRGETYQNAGGTIRKARSKSPRIPDDVRAEIRRLYVKNSREFGANALAKKFNVAPRTILDIVKEAVTS